MSKSAPLSFGQLSVLRHIEPMPQQHMHEVNLRRLVRLPVSDIEAGVSAVRALAARHEALRTTYELGGDGAQIVHDEPDIPLTIAPGQTSDELVDASSRQYFDLTSEPAWRALLTDSPDGRPTLLLVAHHMVCDGWALRRLVAELSDPSAVTEATFAGPRALALAQRSTEWEAKRRRVAAYWQAFLETGAKQVLPTPVAKPETDATRVRSTMALQSQSAQVGQLARRWGVLPQSVLLTAMALGICRLLDSRQCVITLMCSNRFLPGVQSLVTTMNQHVPLLVCFDPDSSIESSTRLVHRSAVRAYQRGCYDPDAITDLVADPTLRPMALDCVFNYMAEESAIDPKPGLGRAEEPRWVSSGRETGARLSLIVSGEESLELEVNSDPKVFSPGRVSDMLHDVLRLLDAATTQPELSTGRLLER